MGDADNIIAVINPEKFYNYDKRKSELRKFKKLIKEKGFNEALKQAKPAPSAEHLLTYDSSTETLEPIYFWILDFMNGMFQGKTEKLVDNFASSPGSGHFSELQGKATAMQQQVYGVMERVNIVLKSILNLIYDLKEFQIRLSQYDEANSKEKERAESGILGLKQIWMDQVDIKRGIGSINAMSSGNLQFVTLRDAFMYATSVEEIDKMDLNERVKRVLKPRVQEFLDWRIRSERELKKRFEIEKTYLKSQVNALKLYSRWAKPYLKAAEQLRMSEKPDSALVSVFNTLILELSVMGTRKLDVLEQVSSDTKLLPENFKKIHKKLRAYNSVVIVDFKFRGIPNKVGQHYSFGGRAEVRFKAYALNDDELKILRDKMEDSDIQDSLSLIQGMTDDSLAQIKGDIDEFLEEKPEKKEKEIEEDTNPFSALFSFFKSEKKEKKSEKKKDSDAERKKRLKEFEEKGIKPDSYAEKYVRNVAEAVAINNCYSIFDIYKKAHGMAALPYVKEAEGKAPGVKAEDVFRIHKFSE